MRRAIERKRDGDELPAALWEDIVASYLEGAVDDSQVAALCMAIFFRGMSIEETAALTGAMARSGERLSFPPPVRIVDKHSTGGVSDIVSLVALPIAAACGAHVAKLSGRALAHTGGTIDKLQAIPGFRSELSAEEFRAQVERVGVAVAAQSERLAPADARLYRLRDRTGTVPCIGLIVASILSKKLAGGAHAYAFDVKFGRGAFTRSLEQARELATKLVSTAALFGRDARALVTDMNEPLGRSIGTGIEVIEARDFLRGAIDDLRVREVALRVAGELLDLSGIDASERVALEALEGGAAYRKFVALVEAQGSSRSALESMSFPDRVRATRSVGAGYVTGVDPVALGRVAREWSVDQATAGIVVSVRTGDRVQRGDVMAYGYGEAAQADAIAGAFTIGASPPAPRPLVYDDE